MRPIVTDFPWSVCVSVCGAKTAEPIEISFAVWTQAGPRNHLLSNLGEDAPPLRCGLSPKFSGHLLSDLISKQHIHRRRSTVLPPYFQFDRVGSGWENHPICTISSYDPIVKTRSSNNDLDTQISGLQSCQQNVHCTEMTTVIDHEAEDTVLGFGYSNKLPDLRVNLKSDLADTICSSSIIISPGRIANLLSQVVHFCTVEKGAVKCYFEFYTIYTATKCYFRPRPYSGHETLK